MRARIAGALYEWDMIALLRRTHGPVCRVSEVLKK